MAATGAQTRYSNDKYKFLCCVKLTYRHGRRRSVAIGCYSRTKDSFRKKTKRHRTYAHYRSHQSRFTQVLFIELFIH